MKVLITGARGQLGHDLVALFREQGREVLGLDVDEMDITDHRAVFDRVASFAPDVIIHGAAWTDVDGCENDPDKAFLVNGLGTRNVAVASASVGAKIAYLSSDYVFDGLKKEPYYEYDPVNPMSVYGRSKLAGEVYVRTLNPRHFVVRTSWVFGLNGKNFVKTIINAGRERGSVRVVDDQKGSPTYTPDLADFLGDLVQSELYGTYHATNSGECSWFDFTKKIFELAGVQAGVEPINTAELNRPAPRPANSVLHKFVLVNSGFQMLRPWEDALVDFLKLYDR